MGLEFLVVVGTIFMLPFVAAGFVAFWVANHRERASVEGVWESYAARRIREFVPARGEWPNRTSPSVRWRTDGARFELSLVGREARARTRLAVWPRERLLGSFRVATLPFGIEEKPAGLAARVLDDDARRALLGFAQREHVELRYQRGQLRLEWTGREANDARIDEAERVLLALARGVDLVFDEPTGLVDAIVDDDPIAEGGA